MGDSDGTLFQSEGKTLCVCRMAFAEQVFPLVIKPTGTGEFIFKELALEGVEDKIDFGKQVDLLGFLQKGQFL